MKPEKNLFVFIVVILFFSCTNESLIDGVDVGGAQNLETAVNIQLPLNGVMTRGIDPETGLYATVKELEIRDCVIAIFDSKGVLTGYKRVVNGDEDLVRPELNSYAITNIITRHGPGMTILVIANSNATFPSIKGTSTYDMYKRIIDSTPFAPDNLVKWGELLTDITVREKSYKVELTQLAARIDVKVKLSDELKKELEKESLTYEAESMKIENIRTKSYILTPETAIPNYGEQDGEVFTTLNLTEKFEVPFYTYETTNSEKPVILTVTMGLTDGNGTAMGTRDYKTILNPLTGFKHGNLYEITAKISGIGTEIELEYIVALWNSQVITIPPFN